MKLRTILTCAFIGVFSLSQSQIVTIKDKSGNVLNDQVYTHTDDNGPSSPDTVKLVTTLSDTFSVNTEITVTRFNMSRCSSSENYFCWAACYTTAISDVDVYRGPDKLEMVPGADTTVFSAYHISNGETGDATYKFGFSEKGNIDTSFVTVTFEVAGVCDDVGVDSKLMSNFNIFPNPATNNITIQSDKNSAYSVNVFDARGAEVSQIKTTFGVKNINTSNLENGVYFIKVTNDEGNYFSKRILINK